MRPHFPSRRSRADVVIDVDMPEAKPPVPADIRAPSALMPANADRLAQDPRRWQPFDASGLRGFCFETGGRR